MRNPLVTELLEILRENSVAGNPSLSAHDMLQRLSDHGAFKAMTDLENQPQLQLFRKNFLLMNGLYQLQRSLWQLGGLYLLVSPLEISLQPRDRNSSQDQKMSNDDSVRSYFLNWQNFHDTNEQDVLSLLQSFWDRFQNPEAKGQARALLGVEVDATEKEIKKRYRKLAADHHPDKGGNEARFIEVRQAYELLMGQ